MILTLVLAYTIHGTTLRHDQNFQSLDLCENAASILVEDITKRGGKVHVARCVPVSLRSK